jgi:hypothetical protein
LLLPLCTDQVENTVSYRTSVVACASDVAGAFLWNRCLETVLHATAVFSHLLIGLPRGLFHSGLTTKTLYAFIFHPWVLHTPPISSSMSWSF